MDETTRQRLINEVIHKVVNNIDSDGDGTPDVEDRSPVPKRFDWGRLLVLNSRYFLLGFLVISVIMLISLGYMHIDGTKEIISYFTGSKIFPSRRVRYPPIRGKEEKLFDRVSETVRSEGIEYGKELFIKEESVYKEPEVKERPSAIEKVEYKTLIAGRKRMRRVTKCGECPHYNPRNGKYGFCTMKNGSITKDHVACTLMRENDTN